MGLSSRTWVTIIVDSPEYRVCGGTMGESD